MSGRSNKHLEFETTSSIIVEDPPGTFTKIFAVEPDHFSKYAAVLPVWWATPYDGDLTSEGAIDFEDLRIMVADWPENGDSIANIALLAKDNIVDFQNFTTLANHCLEGTPRYSLLRVRRGDKEDAKELERISGEQGNRVSGLEPQMNPD